VAVLLTLDLRVVGEGGARYEREQRRRGDDEDRSHAHQQTPIGARLETGAKGPPTRPSMRRASCAGLCRRPVAARPDGTNGRSANDGDERGGDDRAASAAGRRGRTGALGDRWEDHVLDRLFGPLVWTVVPG
jgi:hypothetical protein